jgi:hypothetical protein
MELEPVTHPYYRETAKCRDLPELAERHGDEVALSFPDGQIDRVVAAVAARQATGAALQEKVDGCWCALRLDEKGRVESVTSRSGIYLRVAVGWVGETLRWQIPFWTLVGEVVAGTHWASEYRAREEKREGAPVPIPQFHLYAAFDRQGRRVPEDRVRSLPAWIGHPRLVAVRQCERGQNWGDFTRSVIAAGGEGVVIREADGSVWRAKPRTTVDRVARTVVRRPDRHGVMRHYVVLAVATEDGGLRSIQRVLLPEGMAPTRVARRVVVVVGASEDTRTGMIRHARIVDVREPGDKGEAECTLAWAS